MVLALAMIAAALGGCGGAQTTTTVVVTDHVAVTTTVHEEPTASDARPTSARPASIVRFSACDANIDVAIPKTTCGFAQNAFYEYWAAGGAPSTLRVYSPTARRVFTTHCRTGVRNVLCRTADGGRVRFSLAAQAAYSNDQAAKYAAVHDLGPESTPVEGDADESDWSEPASEDDAPSDDAWPPVEDRIPNFDEGTGNVVQCADGMWSRSGGRPGACSGHGGVG